MDIIFLFFTGFVVGITGAMVPGPLTFFTVSETLKTDRHAGLKIVSGHIVIEAVIIGIIFLGFYRFFNSDIFLKLVSYIGGAALILMGIILTANISKFRICGKDSRKGFNKGLFAGGMLFSIASPGFIIWWATIGISTIAKALLAGIAGVAVFILGHWMADLSWYWLVSFVTHKGKTYLNDSSYQNLVRVFSVLLILLGVWFLVSV